MSLGPKQVSNSEREKNVMSQNQIDPLQKSPSEIVNITESKQLINKQGLTIDSFEIQTQKTLDPPTDDANGIRLKRSQTKHEVTTRHNMSSKVHSLKSR